MEADVETNCLLYDRARNELYAGSWASALLFHSLVEDVLEEDLAPNLLTPPAPLVAWLNECQRDPEQIFAVAASYIQHHQEEEALTMLRRCVELDPSSHLYWCRLSQTLGSLSQWEEALGACEKAVALHATAPRQYLSAGYMLKWKAQCLFMLKRYSEAADAYRFVIEIEDLAYRADSYAQLARCYVSSGLYKDAVNARENEVRDRSDTVAQALKARELDNIGDDIVDTERFLLGEAWLELGRCHVIAGNLDSAEWAFRQAVDADAESIRAYAELGLHLQRQGRIVDAQGQLQYALMMATRKIEATPMRGSLYRDLAFVYRAMENYGEAERAEKRAADLGLER
jgi:superkiller protein 3